MKSFLKGKLSRIQFALFPAVFFSTALSMKAAFIAGLDGVENASTFSGQGVTELGAGGLLGWSNVAATARFFEAGGDGSMIGTTPYGNYTVRYNPLTTLSFQPNTQYSLTFNMGYVAGQTGGSSGYDFSIGTFTGGVYTPLQSASGLSLYVGNMHSTSTAVDAVTLTYTTGTGVPAGDLAIQWAQTSTNGVPNSSDFFGFNKVTLDAAAVPEPSSAFFAAAGVVTLVWRRRRRGAGC
jgi:MYXO-CTERM domain-containing protein